MKIVNRNKKQNDITVPDKVFFSRYVWKILIVDDEEDIRTLTKINLKDFEFDGRKLQFLEADSAVSAKKILDEHDDIALALIDVVMETDDAGLKLVEYIRNELNRNMIRLIIRTGQPGIAPERFIIDNFDIDDYKDKTELTIDKLYTTVRSAIKAYRELKAIDMNRIGLRKIIDSSPEVYRISKTSLSDFFDGILSQIIGLCHLNENALISTIDGMVATVNGEEVKIESGLGAFCNKDENRARIDNISKSCIDVILNKESAKNLRQGSLVLPLVIHESIVGFVYLESNNTLSPEDKNLIEVFTNQCATALEALKLHLNLKMAYGQAIDTLAEIAEFKDSTTGKHINRLGAYTDIVAQAMGVSPEDADNYGKAAMLHDVGKVGIPDSILQKPGKLTEAEYEIMKQHSEIGAQILSHSDSTKLAQGVALYHHERWDGKGYPKGIPSQELPLITRIVAVVDVFDALVSERPYKKAWPHEAALETIKSGSGTQFDPNVVNVFMMLYHDGSLNDILSMN
jgi:response regulator RpfG family c-di-GMP phosphodiesterase